ncbi:hypothetical protein BDW60DRAFT_226516 [Aspergillus nidulans var. acristatus]
MAYTTSELHFLEDDEALQSIGSETESDLQRLFMSGSSLAESTYFDLDSLLGQGTVSTVSTSSQEILARKKSSSFSRHAVNILEQRMETNSENPYPTKDEKASLAQHTGLTVAQESTWLANARRRYKHGSLGERRASEPGRIEPFGECQSASPKDWLSMSPLDRWENSPPEIEPAPLEAIMNAVASSANNSLRLASSTADMDGKDLSATCNNDAQSVVSSNHSRSALSSSSNSSAHSFRSNTSGGSFGCFYLDEPLRRRRRRRRRKTTKSTPTHKRPFQCTFCTDTFRTKHDWTRHEKTLHLSLESFACAPFGPVYTSPTDGTDRCVFCDENCPTKTHIEAHRFTACQERPSSFRTFYRKDHLTQHLRLMHGATQVLPVMDTWKSQVEHVNSRCGFCEKRFTLWSERNNHLAQHFRDGALMKDWQGCRGLDPLVALAVENAMPPYLIGIESAGMNPFSASRLNDVGDSRHAAAEAEVCHNRSTGHNPTPFEYLTACLTQYVQQTSAAGQTVTDEMLQKEARHIVFGDDDPWNQTPADNVEWLKMFKEGVGLGQRSESTVGPSTDPANEEYSEYSFCLPWSADHWTPAGTHPGADSLDMDGTSMAWAWQSPECLVEFRRNMEALSAGLINDEGDFLEPHCSSMHLPIV